MYCVILTYQIMTKALQRACTDKIFDDRYILSQKKQLNELLFAYMDNVLCCTIKAVSIFTFRLHIHTTLPTYRTEIICNPQHRLSCP